LAATKIEPLEIEAWLKSLKDLSNPSKDKIRRVMFLVFKHGQRYGLIPRTEDANPVRWVRQSARSDYEAVSVTPEQAYKIMMELPPMERMLTPLIAATGLRISEALGLQWANIDYDRKQIRVRRAWVDKSVGEPKTRASKAPVPLSHQLGAYLLEWQVRRYTRVKETGFFRHSR
jgi:integrase